MEICWAQNDRKCLFWQFFRSETPFCVKYIGSSLSLLARKIFNLQLFAPNKYEDEEGDREINAIFDNNEGICYIKHIQSL